MVKFVGTVKFSNPLVVLWGFGNPDPITGCNPLPARHPEYTNEHCDWSAHPYSDKALADLGLLDLWSGCLSSAVVAVPGRSDAPPHNLPLGLPEAGRRAPDWRLQPLMAQRLQRF